jgi:hypothetical protein
VRNQVLMSVASLLSLWGCANPLVDEGSSGTKAGPLGGAAPRSDLVVPWRGLLPTITMVNEQEHLELPESLAARVSSDFPGFRVPSETDITGDWAHERHPGSLPFVTWGDYNGDGFVDVALLVLSDSHWKVIVAHQNPDVSISTTEVIGAAITNDDRGLQTPTKLFLSTLKRGDIELDYTSQPPKQLTYNIDTFKLLEFENVEYLYHWNGARYDELLISTYE